PFVAELVGAASEKDPQVGYYSSWIQAAFLSGWALGGGFFGRIADRLGRSRALMLTILTYALFTGLSFFAQTWWQLLLFRFLAARAQPCRSRRLDGRRQEPTGQPLALVDRGGIDRGKFPGGLAGTPARLPAHYCFLVRGVLPGHAGNLWHAHEPRRPVVRFYG